jgi:hypothetical protein
MVDCRLSSFRLIVEMIDLIWFLKGESIYPATYFVMLWVHPIN